MEYTLNVKTKHWFQTITESKDPVTWVKKGK